MKDFVPLEISKKLKEKGFREKCYIHYYPNSKDWFKSSSPECDNYSSYLDAPTISQVISWLRQEKKLNVEPCALPSMFVNNIFIDNADGKVASNSCTYWNFIIRDMETGNIKYPGSYERFDCKLFLSYEQAALGGIEFVLDNLI